MGLFRIVKGAFRQTKRQSPLQSSSTLEDDESNIKPRKTTTYRRNRSKKSPFAFRRRTPSTLPILSKWQQQRSRKYRGYDNNDHDDEHEDWISFTSDQDDDQYPWDPLWKQQDSAHTSTTTSPLTASPSPSYSSMGDSKYWIQLPHEAELENDDDKTSPSRKLAASNGDVQDQHAVLFSNIHMMPVRSLQSKSKAEPNRENDDASPVASSIAKKITFEEDHSTPSSETSQDDVDGPKTDSSDLASPLPLIPTTSFTDIIRASPLASFWDDLMQNESKDSKQLECMEETDPPSNSIHVKSIDSGTHEGGLPPPPVSEVVHHRRNNSDASDVSSLAFPDIPSSRQFSQDEEGQLSLLSKLACATLDESPVYSISSIFQSNQDDGTSGEASFNALRSSNRRHREFNLEQGRRHLEYNLSSGKRAMTKESMAVSEILLRDLEQANQYNNEIESIPEEDGSKPPFLSKNADYTSEDRLENRIDVGMSKKRLASSSSQCRCLVLLMEPETKIFELVRVPYCPEETTLADLLRLVRREATDERLARQTYIGLAHDGMHITAPMVPIDLILTAKVASHAKDLHSNSKNTASAPVLLAVPENYSAERVESMAEKLLASRKVHRLLAMDHYKSASIQLPTKTTQKLSNHRRRLQSTKDTATGATPGKTVSGGPATTVNAPTLGQQVVTWATLNYGSRIKSPSYPQGTAM